jgi:hypothetical protein
MRYTEVAERRPVAVGSDSAGGFHLFAVVSPSCVSTGSKQLSLAEFITINSMSRRLQWTRGKYDGQVNKEQEKTDASKIYASGLIYGTYFLIAGTVSFNNRLRKYVCLFLP